MKWYLAFLYLATANQHKAALMITLTSVISSSVVLGPSGSIVPVNTFAPHEARFVHTIASFLKYTHELRSHMIQPYGKMCASGKTFRDSGNGIIPTTGNICPEQVADYIYSKLISAILNNANAFFNTPMEWQWCHFEYSLYHYATLELSKKLYQILSVAWK